MRERTESATAALARLGFADPGKAERLVADPALTGLIDPLDTDFDDGVVEALGDPEADFDALLTAAEEQAWPLVSFTFGLPAADAFARLATAGVPAGATVTDATEARAALDHGAAFLVVQGHRAGGHRGTSDPAAEPTRAEMPTVLAAVRDSDTVLRWGGEEFVIHSPGSGAGHGAAHAAPRGLSAGREGRGGSQVAAGRA